jgi:response regulator of citrate/malate metabolism
MSINKLEKFEEALVRFKGRYDELEAERGVRQTEVEDLKSANCVLVQEKKEIKKKVDSLLDLLKSLGV